MADVIALAEGVASALSRFGAVVSLVPEFELRDLKEMRVVVAPLGLGHTMRARGIREDGLKVQVGVLKRCSEAELPSLVATVESIGLSLLHKTVADARCTDVKYEPLYHAPHFRERKQFTGVVELTFKEIVRHEPHG